MITKSLTLTAGIFSAVVFLLFPANGSSALLPPRDIESAESIDWESTTSGTATLTTTNSDSEGYTWSYSTSPKSGNTTPGSDNRPGCGLCADPIPDPNDYMSQVCGSGLGSGLGSGGDQGNALTREDIQP